MGILFEASDKESESENEEGQIKKYMYKQLLQDQRLKRAHLILQTIFVLFCLL